MRFIIPCFFLLFFLGIPLALFAQDRVGSWWMYLGRAKFHEDWSWHTVAQYRAWDLGTDLQQLLLQTGIERDVDKGRLGVGYSFLRYQDEEGQLTAMEHRIWEHWVRNHAFGRLKLNDRYRFEHRYIKRDPENVAAGKWEHRFRYNMWFFYPLKGNKIEKGVPFLSAYEEIFLNFSSVLFDQNRIFVAGGYALRDDLLLQAGFLWQHLGQKERPHRRLQLSITFNPVLHE